MELNDKIKLDWKEDDGRIIIYEPESGREVKYVTEATVRNGVNEIQTVTVTFLPYPVRRGQDTRTIPEKEESA